MSLWGPGPFENDDASDWAIDLASAPALAAIDSALIEVSHPAHVGYIDIAECCNAIAAAEVLVRLFEYQHDIDMFDPEVWSALSTELNQLEPDERRPLLTRAIAAVDRVLNDTDDSELAQATQESTSKLRDWHAQTVALLSRLQSAASGLA